MKSQRGFTLIELLVVIAILSVLSFMGVTAFGVYKSSAAYAVAAQTLADARRAMEAGMNNIDNPPGAVGLFTQNSKGAILDPAAKALLPGMMLPAGVKFTVSYDPGCEMPVLCEHSAIEVKHCGGKEYIRWVQLSSGLDVIMPHLAGEGCA